MLVFYIIGLYLLILLVVNIAGVIRMKAWKIGRIFGGNIKQFASVFINNFIDSKALYVHRFNRLPSVTLVNGIDVSKAFEYIKNNYREDIVNVYQHNQYDFDAGDTLFNLTIFVMKDNRIIELGSSYAELFHTEGQFDFANNLAKVLAGFRLQVEVNMPAAISHVQVAGFMRQHEMN